MDDVGGPAEFLYRFQHALCEENGALVIVAEKAAFGIGIYGSSPEIVFVVNEIYLYAGCRNGCDLNYQRAVHVSDNYVDAGKADDLVELVLALIDAAETGHEGADLLLVLLDSLGEVAPYPGNIALGEIGIYLRVHEQDFFVCFSHTNNKIDFNKGTKNFFNIDYSLSLTQFP